MTNDEREAIRARATQNAETKWQKKQNPFDPRDVKSTIFDGDYDAAGGRN